MVVMSTASEGLRRKFFSSYFSSTSEKKCYFGITARGYMIIKKEIGSSFYKINSFHKNIEEKSNGLAVQGAILVLASPFTRCLHQSLLKVELSYLGSELKYSFHHGQFAKKPEGEEDPLEKLMAGTGCLELHYQVQACIFESGDWRKCQKHVQEFRKCMEEHKKRTEAGSQ